ncbi:hypothetical protein J6TS7_53400 [Paenibacillus dendritiformis]|uniref:hypothetical protein n=1 Tax=Paenibacillus TaxID=44249 RepID=UPI001B264309|nr:hypothetical protein [Paenibacillus dendritiformis]GIO81730.1 hypothetical protein J6TS7_53400 [Paenibacillus dendritiformis]
MLKCRIVKETIYVLEVWVKGYYLPINNLDSSVLSIFKSKMKKVQFENIPYRHRDQTWSVQYVGEFDDQELNRLLPVNWERKAVRDHLFQMADDLNHFMKLEPSLILQEAIELNEQFIEKLLDYSNLIPPQKRCDQLTTDEAKLAFNHVHRNVRNNEEIDFMKRTLDRFLTNRSNLTNVEKKIVESWYESLYNYKKARAGD